MRRLPRLHPADRAATALQGGAMLVLGSWCGWTTYLAAPKLWETLPDAAYPWLGAAGGVAGVLGTLGGLLGARVAGSQDARRAINDHLEAQARNRAEQEAAPRYQATAGRHRSEPGRRPGGWAEVNATSAQDARRALDNAAGHRFALPAGTRGSAAPGLEQLPDGVNLTGGPAEDPAVGPDDPRWLPAVRRLAEVLVAEVRPEDGSLAGRGVSQLAAAVAPRVPELEALTVRAFVRDYMNIRVGYRAPSGRDWFGAMPEVADRGQKAG